MDPKHTSSSSSLTWEQLDRYLAGQGADDDLANFHWDGALDPRVEEAMKSLSAIYASAHYSEPSPDRLWTEMETRIADAESSARVYPIGASLDDDVALPADIPRTPSRSASARWYTWTGLLVTTLLLGGGLYWYGGQSSSKRAVPVSSWASGTLVYTTANAQQATITLPDGSTVLLNVGSRLEIPSGWDGHDRVVRLEGEALFKTAHRSSTPFTVVAGPSTTRILGTEFLVRHYPTDPAAVVSVRSGKVDVNRTVLTTMQQAQVLVNGNGRVTVSGVRPATEDQFGFSTGMLMLTQIPLADAIPELNRWYDVDIRLGDPRLGDRRIVAGFKRGSLTDLAAMLDWTFNIYVVREGRMLTLYPKP